MQIESQTCHLHAVALPACVFRYGICVCYLFSIAASLFCWTSPGWDSAYQQMCSKGSPAASVRCPVCSAYGPHTDRGVLIIRPYIVLCVCHLSRCTFPLFGCNQKVFFRFSSSPESPEKAGWGLRGYINCKNLNFVWKEQLIAYNLPVLILIQITKTPVLVYFQ